MAKRVSGAGSVPVRGRFDVTAGCDVDKNYVVIGIYRADSPEIQTREFAQTKESAERASKWLHEQDVQLAIIESTANYHILFHDVFQRTGVRIHVINPLLVKSLLRVEGKSDRGDAATLARLAASFDLRISNMADEQQRQIRLVLRDLTKSNSERTRVTNRTISTITGAGITAFRLVKLNSVSGLGICQGLIDGLPPEAIVAKYYRGKRDKLDVAASLAIPLPDYMCPWLAERLVDIRRLNDYEKRKEEAAISLIEQFNLVPQVTWMTTAPAVTPLLALRIIGEMGQNYWERYHSADAFAKACGVAPSNEVSGGKLLKKKTSYGNVHVKAHLLNAVKAWLAHVVQHRDEELMQFFVHYRERATYKKAVSAVARRILEALWWMGVRGDVYREKRDLRGHMPPPLVAFLLIRKLSP